VDSLRDLFTAVRYPGLIGTELDKLYYDVPNSSGYNETGIDIFAEDWDVLVILDACRYDIFAEVVGNELGTRPLESRISRGSATRKWVEANFTDRTLADLVYVHSNGHYGRLKSEICSDVFKYQISENNALGGRSVHPGVVTSAAITAAESPPHKRFFVHYMQPHHPFFGPSATHIEHKDSYLKIESVRRLVDEIEGQS
jgi:hypothetical protein